MDTYETAFIFWARSKEYRQQNAQLWDNYVTHSVYIHRL